MLEQVFQDVLELHLQSAENALPEEKEFVLKRIPSLKISYKDGTNYEVRDVATLRNVIPGKGRPIESIKIESLFGELSCSIELSTYTWRGSISIRVSGPEDKASHFTDNMLSKLTRETDVTVFARKIWPFAWGLSIASAILLPLSMKKGTNSAQALGVLALVLVAAMILGIAVELFRTRWLPPVAFLWGTDGRRAKQARLIVTTVVATIPLGLLINLASALLFNR